MKIFSLLLFFCLNVHAGCPSPWKCETINIQTPVGLFIKKAAIRAGYIDHDKAASFRGNIIYFQGLADSMLNHLPFFQRLAKEGFRVIAFDYMGQGGSTGNMNDTRIKRIPEIAEIVWKKFAHDLKEFPKKTIIGWSTGGLAAYYVASLGKADQVVLIAPGISPKPVMKITMNSLTSERYDRDGFDYSEGKQNPHLEGIYPKSPLFVPDFTLNLLSTAVEARFWDIPKNVKGLVLLSGKNDKYVFANDTKKVLKKNAPSFQVLQHSDALHEIDNETLHVRTKFYEQVINFLNN
jgi:pimeloyl-ACP methyl ester carboxylesterase